MPRSAVALARIAATTAPALTPDAQLLRAFIASNGDDCFAELVRRHGPMVLAACRRVLSNAHDAEDAFQATFLVLARRAASVRGTNVGAWLYAVAVRTARGVRVMRDRRRKRISKSREPEVEASPVDTGLLLTEQAAVIDEELANLPAHYRDAVVVCELRGLSRKEAAAELGIAEGTLSSRLATAKRKLAEHLSARGLAGVALATALAPVAVSAGLMEATAVTVRGAAGGVASAAASTVLKGMLFDQLRASVLAGAVLGAMVCGGLALTGVPPDAPGKDGAPAPRAVDRGEPKNDEPAKGAKFWPRFAKLIGDDRASRELFDLIASEPKNLELLGQIEELLKKADEPDAGPDALFAPEKLYLGRRDELNELLRVREVGAPEPVSLAAVYCWMYLGTFPRTDHPGKATRRLDFVPEVSSPKSEQAELVRHLAGPNGAAGKRLLGAWAERQTPNDSCRVALNLAFRYEIKEALPAARKALAESSRLRPEDVNGPKVGAAFQIVGKYGSEADAPTVAKFLTNTRAFTGHRPGDGTKALNHVEGEHISNQIRDTAAVVLIVLRNGSPEDFGFIWTKTEAAKLVPWARQLGTDPLDVQIIGFSTDADRTTAHKKAKAFLDKQRDAPKKDEPDPALAKWVEQLGSANFAEREAAEKELRKLGLKAEAALKTGLRSDDPEIRARCAKLLIEIRKDALAALVQNFDPKAEAQPDHPIWQRFKDIAGNTPASRELFARVIKNSNWLARLDAATAGPEAAAEQYRRAVLLVEQNYRASLSAVGRNKPAPCDTPGEVIYLLFLGSFEGTEKAKPASDPDAARFVVGEGRLYHARGLELGLQGKEAGPGSNKKDDAALAPGSERCFAKLLGAWLVRRTDPGVLYGGFERAVRHRAVDVLSAARAIASAEQRTAGERGSALCAVAQFGARADLPLFTGLDDDATIVLVPPPPAQGGLGPRSRRFQVRDHAVALALLLYDQDPFEYGFTYARDRFRITDRRPDVANYEAESFGAPDEETRAAAHKKAKAFLGKQKDAPKKDEPDPALAKWVEQLGSANFAEREAAEQALKEHGGAAKSAVRAGLKSEDPEIVRRCAALLPTLRRADWQRVRAAYDRDPAAFDHPVWQKLKAVVGDGPDARAILADILADEPGFSALVEALEDPKVADRLYRQAHGRLEQSLKYWYAAETKNRHALAMGKWVPERGVYPAMLLLGTFPDTGTVPDHRGNLNALTAVEQAGWSACWFGLWGTGKRPSAGTQRLFVAWLGARANPNAAATGISMMRMLGCREGADLARAVAADRDRPVRGRVHALLYLGTIGTADDAALAAALFNDTTEFQSAREKPVQVRDIATAVALVLHKLDPVEFGFSVKSGPDALRDYQLFGFASDIVRDPVLREAQAKIEELNRARAADRLAPPPRPRP